MLVLLALIPIAIWGYTAYGTWLSYEMAEQGSRKTGYAAVILSYILAALTPALFGAIAMIVGAARLRRQPLGARVTASIGIVLVLVTLAIGFVSEFATAHYSMFIAGAAYVLLHIGVVTWLWHRRQSPAV